MGNSISDIILPGSQSFCHHSGGWFPQKNTHRVTNNQRVLYSIQITKASNYFTEQLLTQCSEKVELNVDFLIVVV